ncbi:hypothetical protein AB0C59_13310 [Streptomyces sp. NPDC048664]|uniref:hypothetical protein n=1 Tax=Streptomyces sp. NPDC048664 TaxID=3154505 RepID=UPI003447FAA2
MRLSRRARSGPRLSLAAWCVLVAALLPQTRATALPVGQPECAATDGTSFPLTTRIHGGPDAYEAGGAAHTWFIDLTNTTGRSCGSIHPVVVLVDAHKALTVGQPELEFFDGERAHPVTFVRTDRAELVGAFDDGFPGFTVGAGRTVAVKVRLAVAAGTAANDVVVNAAVVQRRGGDGDWVGESDDYRFRIEAERGTGVGVRPDADRRTGAPSAAATGGSAGQVVAGTGAGAGAAAGPGWGYVVGAGVVGAAGVGFLLHRVRRGGGGR